MIKKFYIFGWLVLLWTAVASISLGTFDALTMVGVSLGAVGLVYGFALWAVLVNPAQGHPSTGGARSG